MHDQETRIQEHKHRTKKVLVICSDFIWKGLGYIISLALLNEKLSSKLP